MIQAERELKMIRIIAEHIIKKECIEKYHQLAKELVEKSRAEAGCVSYELEQNIEDERVHVFVESWADQEAIDTHNQSEHFKRLVPQLGALFDGKESVKKFNKVF